MELHCKIYTQSLMNKEAFTGLICELMQGQKTSLGYDLVFPSNAIEVNVTTNDEYNLIEAKNYPDGFLYFRFFIDVYIEKESISNTDKVDFIAFCSKLLTSCWDQGMPAIASSDFETQFPYSGGYKIGKDILPWA